MRTLPIYLFRQYMEQLSESQTILEKIIITIIHAWIVILFSLFVVGFAVLMYGIISGEADIDNATFGVFDTLG